MKFKLVLITLLSLLFFSCDDSLEDFTYDQDDYDYFPLEIGNTWIYQVDSVVYDNNGIHIDSISVQIKEVITEKYVDNAGQEAYRLARYKYDNVNGNWRILDVWSASMDSKLAYRTEENLRFAKLSFPVIHGNLWDGNAFIQDDIVVKIAGEPIKMYQNWEDYTYVEVGVNDYIGGISYDSVCTVLQTDIEDKISKRYSLEKYAKGFGLVYKKMIILNTQNFDSPDPWEEKAEEGFILEQTLLSFEK